MSGSGPIAVRFMSGFVSGSCAVRVWLATGIVSLGSSPVNISVRVRFHVRIILV